MFHLVQRRSERWFIRLREEGGRIVLSVGARGANARGWEGVVHGPSIVVREEPEAPVEESTQGLRSACEEDGQQELRAEPMVAVAMEWTSTTDSRSCGADAQEGVELDTLGAADKQNGPALTPDLGQAAATISDPLLLGPLTDPLGSPRSGAVGRACSDEKVRGSTHLSESTLYRGLSLRTPWADVYMKFYLEMNTNVLPPIGIWGFARRRARVSIGVLCLIPRVTAEGWPIPRVTAEGWPILQVTAKGWPILRAAAKGWPRRRGLSCSERRH